VDASEGNQNFIERLFDGSTEITEELFSIIEEWIIPRLAKQKAEGTAREGWSIDIKKYLDPEYTPKKLLVSECLWTDGAWLFSESLNVMNYESETLLHDVSLLGFQSVEQIRNASKESIATGLANTKILRWLTSKLQSASDKELYFGSITAQLHNALVNDPKPYRRDVKDMVKNLYQWVGATHVNGLVIDQPGRHSERMRIASLVN
jgi:hypothetical protein